MRERAIFEAASEGLPREFLRLCKLLGRDPKEVLDGFDAAPWRWMIVSVEPLIYVDDSAKDVQFPTRIRARLEVTREYVERPWWRRLGRH